MPNKSKKKKTYGIPTGGFEERLIDVDGLEIRQDGEGETLVSILSGHAALFNVESVDLGGFIEVIRPGAFAKTIAENDVRMHWNHNRDYVFGRTKSETLRLSEDDTGLAFENDVPGSSLYQSFADSIQRGDVDQMSFGFRAMRENWIHSEDPSEPDLRELIELKLIEISPVVYAAYQETDVSARGQMRAFNPEILTNGQRETPATPRQAAHLARRFHTLRLLELNS